MAIQTQTTWMDTTGKVASLTCAVHCMATPFLLALAPSLGLAAWNETWETPLLVFMSVLALTSLTIGTHGHRHFHAWFLLLPGLLLAWSAHLLLPEDMTHQIIMHRIIMVTGGLLVAGAHALNQRFTHRLGRCKPCEINVKADVK